MKPIIPPFAQGTHWRKLAFWESLGSEWSYKTLTPVTVRFLDAICEKEYSLYSKEGCLWGHITPHAIRVMPGYWWGGSSCAPDAGTMLASLVHDLLYQFSGVPEFPLTRKFADNLFFSLAKTPLRALYRLGLFVGSWAYWNQNPEGFYIKTR